jgi:hypothetical protein
MINTTCTDTRCCPEDVDRFQSEWPSHSPLLKCFLLTSIACRNFLDNGAESPKLRAPATAPPSIARSVPGPSQIDVQSDFLYILGVPRLGGCISSRVLLTQVTLRHPHRREAYLPPKSVKKYNRLILLFIKVSDEIK